jgi:hypothetical protein
MYNCIKSDLGLQQVLLISGSRGPGGTYNLDCLKGMAVTYNNYSG